MNRFYSLYFVGIDTYWHAQQHPVFPRILLDSLRSPALSGLQEKLRGGAALNTLSDFFETFGFIIPDSLLHRRPPGANSRQRRFTVHVTFWAFLAQTLAPKYSAGSSSTAASTKARQRPKGCTQEEFDALPTSLRSQTPRQIQTS